MNFQFYLEKLHNSSNFKNFMKKNPEAFFCSGFFIIDKKGSDNKIHLDYFMPKSRKIMSFQLESSIQEVPIELMGDKVPSKVFVNHDFDFDDIEKLILDEMQKQGVKNKIEKIILSLQEVDNKDYLIATVFVSMLGILKIHILLPEKKITLFEKKSFFDIVNVLKKPKKKD